MPTTLHGLVRLMSRRRRLASNSHRSLMDSHVTVLFLDVLPRIAPGCSDACSPTGIVRRAMFRKRRVIALTFDDGPGAETPDVLDVLARHDARGTFFVVGRAVEGRVDLLRRMAAAGHEIGNHTYDHPRLSELTEDLIVTELERTSRAIESATSVRPVLMRPPYGDDPLRVSEIAAPLGLTTVLWSVPTFDWRGDDPSDISERIVTGARPGAVVVLHDASHLGESRMNTVEALQRAVPVLAEAGYELVTVSELLRSAPYAGRWVVPRRRTGLRRIVDGARRLRGGARVSAKPGT